LHLNGLGKELLSSHLLHIYSVLEEDKGSTINGDLDIDDSSRLKTRTSSRSKKAPVTEMDFL
jgi:hypothetical protein